MPITETEYPALVMPPTVERSAVTIWSNGVALDGDIYRPRALGGEQRAPAVVLSHGWGGSKRTAERYAARFAEAGMVCLCFTYSGWFGSAGHALLVDKPPGLDASNEGTARLRVIRDLVDPIEWLQNYRSAIDYIEGEPNVDARRIGAWGTSFGGGIAMHTAANDARIQVLVVQVAALASILKAPAIAHARQRAIDIARGRIAPVPQGIDAFSTLAGTPHLARFLQYDVMREVGKLDAPTLMMDAGDEAFFDIREHSGKACELLAARGAAPVEYRVIDGIDHYGIYFDGYEESSALALQWYLKHL